MGRSVDVLVIGAGVIGLTTAVHLAENNLRVEVRSACIPQETTSAAAGAMWGLSFIELTDEVVNWGRDTLACLSALAADPSTGVRLVEGVEASRSPNGLSATARLLPSVRRCVDLPDGYRSGWRFATPLLDMPSYLTYLTERLQAAGGQLRVERISCLDEVRNVADVVLNCTGAEARELVPDPAVRPVRGQLVVLENPGISEFFAEESEDDDLVYILPHGDSLVLGGTAEDGNVELAIDDGVGRRIIERCSVIAAHLGVENLRRTPVLAHRVGFRPRRPSVRLDLGRQPKGRWLGHCYGHGGAGVSLSWGCAHEILARLKAVWS